MSPIWYFDELQTFLSCIQFSIQFSVPNRVRDYRNQRIKKIKYARQGKIQTHAAPSKSHFETGIPVWAPKHCAKKIDQFLKKVSYIVQKTFMCIWCISTNKNHFIEEKFHKIWSEIFFGCLSQKISNEKDVIVNNDILNKSKDLPFVSFFFQRKHTCIFICIFEKFDFKNHIYNIKRTKICSIYTNMLFK